jgi:hypothetical protein
MTDAGCSICNRRLRWGDWRDEHGGGRGTYCPVHQPHLVQQPIAIPIEVEWRELPLGVTLEDLLPDPTEVDVKQ